MGRLLKRVWSVLNIIFIVMVLGAATALPQQALAAGGDANGALAIGDGRTPATWVNTVTTGWIANLITAALALATLLQVFDKWKDIFSGDNAAKHVIVIAAYVCLTIWWNKFFYAAFGPGG